MRYSVKKLEADDWTIFSEIRLRALRSDPKVFGSTYEREVEFSETDWRTRLADPDTAVFVVLESGRAIGMTGAAVDRDDSSRRTVLLWGSWVEPDARGRGISKLFYESRIAWARTQPGVERIIVSHRESNDASRFANQKFDFVFTRETTKLWNDGITERELHYELIL